MQIVVDGKIIAVDPENKTLGDVLNSVQNKIKDTDRMVVSIKCNNKILNPEEIVNFLTTPADTFEYIEFQTANPRELAKDALLASKEMLETIKHQIDIVVEQLPSAPGRAMEIIGEIFTQFNGAHQGIYGTIRLFKIDPESIELSTGSADKLFNNTIEKLTDIKQALTNKDTTILTDILQYELKPLIDVYTELVDSLLENVEAK